MEKIHAHILGSSISSNSPEAFSLLRKSHFGAQDGEKVQYSLPEALFLAERGIAKVYHKNKIIGFREFIRKAHSIDKKIGVKYPTFKDLRQKGYVVKTALKFRADFRVYEKGVAPGEKHAKWIVFTDHESAKIGWHEFSAKNRVAHSTKKNLLLAIVDDENDVSYYEVRWIKP